MAKPSFLSHSIERLRSENNEKEEDFDDIKAAAIHAAGADTVSSETDYSPFVNAGPEFCL